MRDIMLILHFIGLAMGVGAGFANMFLAIATRKLPADDAVPFRLKTLAISPMGHIGLALLIVSGVYLLIPFWPTLGSMPILIAKLIGVLLLTILVIVIAILAKKAKHGNASIHLAKMEKMGPMTLLLAIATLVLAVLAFH